VIIATKVGMWPVQPGRLTAKNIIAACEASLQRLQTDYIDLYQSHRMIPRPRRTKPSKRTDSL
jgi:aryl-alcohol dehydrogenase-like predicted oxidoreductase